MQPGMGFSRCSKHVSGPIDTEWERRTQEYEGESPETFSDDMKIAVPASHAPESIRNVVRLAAGPANGNYRAVRQNMSEFLHCWPNLRQGWSRSRVGTQQCERDADGRCMVLARAREWDASCADVPATQRKTASSIKPRARAKAQERKRVARLTRTLQPSLKASAAIVARKVTSGQTAGSVCQKRKTIKSTPLMERRQQQRWRQWKTQR